MKKVGTLVFEEPSCEVIDKSLGDSTVLMGEVRDKDPTLRRYSLNGGPFLEWLVPQGPSQGLAYTLWPTE